MTHPRQSEMTEDEYYAYPGEPMLCGYEFTRRRRVRARKRYNRFARKLPRFGRIANPCWSRVDEIRREYEAWAFGARRHP